MEIGFLGAGVIVKGEIEGKKGDADSNKVINLNTAASIWFSATIGMAIGFNYYLVAIVSIAFAVLVPCIPSIKKRSRSVDT